MLEREKKLDIEVKIPAGVQASLQGDVLVVKGVKGETRRSFQNPLVKISCDAGIVRLVPKKSSQREKRMTRTFEAHIKNMFRGVLQGHVYSLKICSGHFPMTVVVKGNLVEIKNFIGEKVPRTSEIPEGAKVKIEGDHITVEGVDKEKVSEAAARIEKLTRRPGFDPRIFQDGIYIIEKDGKKIA